MNNPESQLPAKQSSAIQAPSTPEAQAFALLQRQATLLASSTLVPKEFQGNVSNCAIGIEIANRLHASAFMVIQNIDIIHGRPSFRATFLIAMVNASGRFSPLMFRLEGEGAKRTCAAYTKVIATGETVEGPMISMEMAKAEGWSTKSGSKWLTMPELMLRYRSAAFFARIYAPDITLGMQTSEEVQDFIEPRDVTPQAAESKLFQPVAKKEAPPLILDSSALSPRETFLAKVQALDVPWEKVGEVLFQNGVLNDPRATAADCEAGEMSFALEQWAQLEKIVKGGSAK